MSSNKLLEGERKDSKYGRCPICKKSNTDFAWCGPCDRHALKQKFDTWTTGNFEINVFIQETQADARNYNHYLEYIPYDRFKDVKTHVDDDGFAIIYYNFVTIYKATWLDGERKVDNDKKTRSNPMKVILKKVNTSDTAKEILFELMTFHEVNEWVPAIKCYGVTRNDDGELMIVIEDIDEDDSRKWMSICAVIFK